MANPQRRSLPKIRTYALDQAHARGEVSVPITAAPSNVPKSASTQPTVLKTIKEAPIVVKETTPLQPPAFHELQQKAQQHLQEFSPNPSSKNTKDANAKKVVVRTKETNRMQNSSTEGVIITDNKRDANSGPSVVESLSNWFKALITPKDPTPRYTVQSVDRRKGVIKKATTGTGAVFSTDSSTLKQEIVKRREIAQEVERREILWTPNTEVGSPLLTGTTTSEEMPDKQSDPTSLPSSWDDSPQTTQPKADAPQICEQIEPKVVEPQEIVKPPAPPVRVFVPQSPPTQPLPTPAAPEVAAPIALRNSIPHTPNPRSSYLKNGLRQLVRFDTTLTTVVLVGSIVSFVLVFFIVRTFLGMIMPHEAEVAISTGIPMLKNTVIVEDLAISAISKEALRNALNGYSSPQSGVSELQITDPNGLALSGEAFWNMLETRSHSSLAKTTRSAHLGHAAGNTFIVLEVSDTTTAFGALLAWENSMPEDLAVIFGQSGTVNNVVDQTISTSDIRILREGDKVLLVYGFVGKNMILITTSTADFEAASL